MKSKRLVSVISTFLIICSFSFPVSALTLGELMGVNPWGDEYVKRDNYISFDELYGEKWDFFEARIYKKGDFLYFFEEGYNEHTKETQYYMYIHGYWGDNTTINIPESINGWPVVGIFGLTQNGVHAQTVETINIPSSVVEIYEHAISEFKNLKKIHFEENSRLTHIQYRAFYNNIKLEEINLPNSLATLGRQAFFKCSSLKEITIPKNCTDIEEDVFYCCDNLETIKFAGDKVNYRYIDYDNDGDPYYTKKENRLPVRLAANCPSLKSINIPESVKVIGEGAFENSGLTSITIPKNVKTVYKDAFKGCGNLTSVKFAGAVNNIGKSAFSRCVNLKSVNFTKGYLKKVYDYAFYKCEKLEKITISNTKNVPTIAKSAFNKAKSGIKFYVKNNTVAKKLKSKLQKTNIKKAKIYRSAPILLYKNVG